MGFPKDFLWGVSTASFQIEGAAYEDGKGLSVWDVFCKKPGNVRNGHTGDVACDFYHRYREDAALMKEVGLKAHRFSVSWPRILPEGTGAINEKGLDFYDRLVDAFLEAGVRPFCCLYHWDMPWALQARGGWLNYDISTWFGEYAHIVTERLSDRVTDWVTLLEPFAFLGGHWNGKHAPGIRLPVKQYLQCAHDTHMAHGRATQAIRAHAKRSPRVSMSHVGPVCVPLTDSLADLEAARILTCERADGIASNAWMLDPLYKGEYPADEMERFGEDAPDIRAGDMEIIHQRPDWFALNFYHAAHGRMNESGEPERMPANVPPGRRTAFDWEMTPDGIYWAIRFHHERYGLPITITENGMANLDWPSVIDGGVHDPQRIDFQARHLQQVRRAIEDGYPVEGYFIWSLLDNFEWAEGYEKRFGLIYVDYETQERIPKDSYAWYQDVIASNGASLP